MVVVCRSSPYLLHILVSCEVTDSSTRKYFIHHVRGQSTAAVVVVPHPRGGNHPRPPAGCTAVPQTRRSPRGSHTPPFLWSTGQQRLVGDLSLSPTTRSANNFLCHHTPLCIHNNRVSSTDSTLNNLLCRGIPFLDEFTAAHHSPHPRGNHHTYRQPAAVCCQTRQDV